MTVRTADLCDEHMDVCSVAEPIFRDFGARTAFGGEIETVRVFEDNVLVRKALETPGRGRVLVVDGGGSLRRALVGDRLAGLALRKGWVGLVIHGCIRDADSIGALEIGIKALATCPRPSEKAGAGETGAVVRFAGVDFVPGHFVYADRDGLVTATRSLG